MSINFMKSDIEIMRSAINIMEGSIHFNEGSVNFLESSMHCHERLQPIPEKKSDSNMSPTSNVVSLRQSHGVQKP